MNNISPLASVSPKAILGDNVEIGPFAFVDDDVEIGDGCKIFPHATVFQYVKMGKNCQIYPGAVVGAVPQDLKFEGEVTSVELGDNVTVRECATINRGTKASGKYVTKVGSDTLIMSYSHVAHDCVIGDHCILVSYVGLAGETVVDDWAIIGGGSKAHQFSKVGCQSCAPTSLSAMSESISSVCAAGVSLQKLSVRSRISTTPFITPVTTSRMDAPRWRKVSLRAKRGTPYSISSVTPSVA